MSIFSKIFGDANERIVNKYTPIVARINELEKEFEGFSDEKLKEKIKEARIQAKEQVMKEKLTAHNNIECDNDSKYYK